MAEIKMDVSEYEALKKNIQLLEESRVREQKLNLELQELKNEKILNLMDAEKSVSMINKTIREEVIYIERDRKQVQKACKMLADDRPDFYHQLIDAVFEKHVKQTVVDATVVTKGFDEVRKEIEEKYLSELSQETQQKLKRLETVEKQLQNYMLDLQSALDKEGEARRKKFEVEESLNKMQQQHTKFMLESNDFVSKVSNCVQYGTWDIFSFQKRRRELKSILGINEQK